jgi:hypothetical protein
MILFEDVLILKPISYRVQYNLGAKEILLIKIIEFEF